MTDELRWEALESTIAYSCPGFDVIREDVRLPDGTVTDFDYLSEPPAVVILPFTTEGEVVVIEEWRHAVDRVSRGIPAGTVEGEEPLEEAARRELAEETGYEAERVEHVTSVEPANGVADTVHHYFLARNCEPSEEQNLDVDESIRVDTTSLERLREEIDNGEIVDGRAITGVLYYDAFVSDGDGIDENGVDENGVDGNGIYGIEIEENETDGDEIDGNETDEFGG